MCVPNARDIRATWTSRRPPSRTVRTRSAVAAARPSEGAPPPRRLAHASSCGSRLQDAAAAELLLAPRSRRELIAEQQNTNSRRSAIGAVRGSRGEVRRRFGPPVPAVKLQWPELRSQSSLLCLSRWLELSQPAVRLSSRHLQRRLASPLARALWYPCGVKLWRRRRRRNGLNLSDSQRKIVRRALRVRIKARRMSIGSAASRGTRVERIRRRIDDLLTE